MANAGCVVAAVSTAVGAMWIALEHRRVRRIETRWLAEHPDRCSNIR